MPKGKKYGGRTAGTPNKVTAGSREALKNFLDAQRPAFERAFTKLSPKEKVYAYTRLLPFITPQYSAINFSLSNMSDSDLQFLIGKLKEQFNEDTTD